MPAKHSEHATSRRAGRGQRGEPRLQPKAKGQGNPAGQVPPAGEPSPKAAKRGSEDPPWRAGSRPPRHTAERGAHDESQHQHDRAASNRSRGTSSGHRQSKSDSRPPLERRKRQGTPDDQGSKSGSAGQVPQAVKPMQLKFLGPKPPPNLRRDGGSAGPVPIAVKPEPTGKGSIAQVMKPCAPPPPKGPPPKRSSSISHFADSIPTPPQHDPVDFSCSQSESIP